MKKSLTFLSLSALLLILIPLHARAAVVDWGDNYMVPKGTTITSNLYVAGQQLTLIGNVQGDVVGGGGNVFVNDTVDGDVLLAGGTVNVVASVTHDVRLIGNTIVVSSKVGGDFVALGNNIRVVEGTTIGGDVVIAGNTIAMLAPVLGSVRISGADVFINSAISGNVMVIADRLHIGPNTKINGTLTYRSVREASIDQGAVILGDNNFQKVEADQPSGNFLSFIWSSWFSVKFITLFVSAMILYAVGKKSMTALSRRARSEVGANLFAGFLFFVGVPIAVLLLIMTVIGVPLSIAVLGLSLLFVIVSIAFMPIFVGSTIKHWLKKGDSASWKAILLGSLIVIALGVVPFLGFIIRTGLFFISTGVFIRITLEKLQSIR